MWKTQFGNLIKIRTITAKSETKDENLPTKYVNPMLTLGLVSSKNLVLPTQTQEFV
jgi:hypothetical protein